MQNLVQCARVGRVLATHPVTIQRKLLSTSVVRAAMYEKPDYSRLHNLYAKFQVPNDVPVHLKGGKKDLLYLYGTCILIGIGLVMMGTTFYEMAYPPKAKPEGSGGHH